MRVGRAWDDPVDIGYPTITLTDVTFDDNQADLTAPSLTMTETTFVIGGGGASFNFEGETVTLLCGIDHGCD